MDAWQGRSAARTSNQLPILGAPRLEGGRATHPNGDAE
jgi:hypothetical protein